MKRYQNVSNQLCQMGSSTVLVVEDSKFFAKMLIKAITESLGFDVVWNKTYAEATATIDCCKDSYLVALLDLSLPDAPNGEIVDYATQKGIPSIIFTGGFDGEQRSRFHKWNVVDYILKDSSAGIETLLEVLDRINRNCRHQVLVVDDSRSMREAVCNMLRAQLFSVLEACDGQEALAVLEENPDIKLVVTAYDMPKMNGVEFIEKVREEYSKNELAIIGLSASDDPLLSVRLIKSGANDFIHKPFQVEEFQCRVGHAVEMLENIELIRDLSFKDPLTRLHNRRYFFENAEKFMQKNREAGQAVSVAMLDIDFFKKVNDTYGHDGGDLVLERVASVILGTFKDDAITCRFGGEEFCVLLAHHPDDSPVDRFDRFRQVIEDTEVVMGDDVIRVTMSTGVCSETDTIEAMLKLADSRLYTAKESGRNRVVGRPPKTNVRA